MKNIVPRHCLALLALAAPLFPVANSARADVTDAQVEADLKKGVDFLLSRKNGDTWEPAKVNPGEERLRGGVTAVIIYALLETRQSLDDPEYRARLGPNGAELLPAIEWLSKQQLTGTYAQGFRAAALSAIPQAVPQRASARNAGEPELRTALEATRDYLVREMGPDGGYTYEKSNNPPPTKEQAALQEKAMARYNANEIVVLKKYYDELLAAQRSGATTITDRLDRTRKITVSKEDLARNIEIVKTAIERLQLNFHPRGDTSNAQAATVGAWLLDSHGVDFPKRYWQVQERFWRLSQKPDGSWPYYLPNPDVGTPAMTPAGIASLLEVSEIIDADARPAAKADKNVDAGLAWLDRNYTGAGDAYYYYTLQRVGMLTGRRTFAQKNWYLEGANALLNIGRPNRGDLAQRMATLGVSDLPTTALRMLFLARGRNPVLINKLQYAGNWNAWPRDALLLVRAAGKRADRGLNWQVVDLKADLQQWLESPILLITGNIDPKFTPDDLQKLRDYIAAGGTIVSTADASSGMYTTAIRKYAEELYDKRFPMKPLPKDHKLFSRESGVNPANIPALLAMSDGHREIWIHSSADLAADWSANRPRGQEFATALFYYVQHSPLLRNRLRPVSASNDPN